MIRDEDWQIWWRQQTAVVPPSEKELGRKALHLKRCARNKQVISSLILVATLVFLCGIAYIWKPRFITTYVGIGLMILAIGLQLGAARGLLSLLTRREQPDQDARHYLELLIGIKAQQKFLQTRILTLYFILITTGAFLTMIEYTRDMSAAGKTRAYGLTAAWFAIAWWVLRPWMIRKETRKLDAVIGPLESLQAQLMQDK
jgi:hypothetical protein